MVGDWEHQTRSPFHMNRFLPLLLALALVGAACSTTTDSGVASLDDTTAPQGATADDSPEEVDTEAVLLEFAQCMRDNGLPDYEDPTVDENGNPQIFRPGGQTGEVDRETMRATMEACSEYLEQVQLGFDRPDESERQDQMLALAECLRDQGLEVDDPDFSAGGPGGGGILGDLDRDDPEVQAAMEICIEEAGFTGGGPGGGPGGPAGGAPGT